MRKFLNLLCFDVRNYCRTSYFYRHAYCNSFKIKTLCNVGNKSYVNKAKMPFSTKLSSKRISEKDMKDLLEEYPVPKQIVQRLLFEAFLFTEDPTIEPIMTVQQKYSNDGSNESLWHATLTMYWPEKFQVEGLGQKKTEAEKTAYLMACQKFKEYGRLNNDNGPILPQHYSKNELRVAKTSLCNIFNKLWPRLGNRNIIPQFYTSQEEGIFHVRNIWKTRLVLKYPEHKTFNGMSGKLGEAEQIASMKALAWLQEKGIINDKKHLIAYSKDEQEEMLSLQNMPYPLHVPDCFQEEMKDVLKSYANLKQNEKWVFVNPMTEIEDCERNDMPIRPINILNEEPYYPLSKAEADARNKELLEHLESIKNTTDSELLGIQKDRLNLPIADRREDILNLIRENQVVVLSGETGCGKTTQVPQYILDSFIMDSKGSECNIVATQPRRISAMSIAERVATERGEPVGQTIGYQVRLNKCLPSHGHGGVLFCSTGMLLRKLCYNPNLDGITHVIVDEIHERSVQIDFLLILLKEILEQNQNIKLILMSASFNTTLFSQYFDNCPIIHIPGKIFPVREYFLDDIAHQIKYNEAFSSKPKLDVKLLASLIEHADAVEPPGAILCFLPGWNEISLVANELNEIFAENPNYCIHRLHSRLLPEEQKKVFLRPPEGVRKIVLTTNVAECSITINDVVCVVDSGFHKMTSFDNYTGAASLGVQWITKANVKQRRGRAGRIRPGTCYYAFPRSVLTAMGEYPIPEMQRMPLEKVVLDCKLYCPNTKAQEFLSLALQPPSKLSIQMGVHELMVMDILDQNENLTTLGNTIIHFATHPRLSKALVMATFLRCVDPVLTIAAFLTFSQDPFSNSLDNANQIKLIKQYYDEGKFSDHLVMYNLFCKWDSMSDEELITLRTTFAEENLLDEDSFVTVKKLKGLFAENLLEAGLVNNINDAFYLGSIANQNSENTEMILAALTSGFYPNVIKIQQGEIYRGYLNKDTVTYSTINNQAAILQSDSIASKEYTLPSPWLIYSSMLKSEARMSLIMPRVSCTPGLCFLFFSGQELCLRTKPHPAADSLKNVTLLIDNYEKLSFSCPEDKSQVISDWRQSQREMFQTYLDIVKERDSEKLRILQDFLDGEMLPILRELLKVPQAPFARGKIYTLADGEFISCDL